MELLNAIKNVIIKDRAIILASLCGGVIVASVAGVAACGYSDYIQSGISSEVMRFQVRANSDSPYDQAIKLAVRDNILEEYRDELEKAESLEETREILFLNMEGIEDVARDTLRQLGYERPVSACIVQDFFPTKSYADITLPAGKYEALRVDIGDAGGQNWWCVMYPPLCYVDAAQPEAPENTKQVFREALSDEEYKIVTVAAKDNAEDKNVKARFKIVEWWQNMKEDAPVQLAYKN